MDILDKENEKFAPLAKAIFVAAFAVGKFTTFDGPNEAWEKLVIPSTKAKPRMRLMEIKDWKAL